MDDDKGTSLVLIHSPKGENIFAAIGNLIKYKQANYKEAIKYNQSIYQSARKPNNRNKFMRAVAN